MSEIATDLGAIYFMNRDNKTGFQYPFWNVPHLRQRPSQATRLYHSATNRIRDQQRIEQENLAFLRRLQGARASNDLRRDVLLQDYERQTGKTVYSAKPRQRRSMKRSTRQMQQAGRQTWQDSWWNVSFISLLLCERHHDPRPCKKPCHLFRSQSWYDS